MKYHTQSQTISQVICDTNNFIESLPRLHNPLFTKLKRRLIEKIELLSKNNKFLMESNYYLKKTSYKPPKIQNTNSIIDDIFIDIPYWNIESPSYDNIITNNMTQYNQIDEGIIRFKLEDVFIKMDKCDVLLSYISNPDEYLFQKYYEESRKIFQRMTTFITYNQLSVEDATNYKKILNCRFATNIYVLHQQISMELGYSKVEIKIDNKMNIKLNINTWIKLPNIGVKLNLFIKRNAHACAVFKNFNDIIYIEKHLERIYEYIIKISKLNIKFHDFMGTL
jgi:hypothetical protein